MLRSFLFLLFMIPQKARICKETEKNHSDEVSAQQKGKAE